MKHIRIIGIDPGLRRTGWGIISVCANQQSFVAADVVATDPTDSLARRLLALFTGLQATWQRSSTPLSTAMPGQH